MMKCCRSASRAHAESGSRSAEAWAAAGAATPAIGVERGCTKSPVTQRISRLIHEQASSSEIKREALNDGMLTLREYGIKKIAFGDTSFEEAMAVTDDRSVY